MQNVIELKQVVPGFGTFEVQVISGTDQRGIPYISVQASGLNLLEAHFDQGFGKASFIQRPIQEQIEAQQAAAAAQQEQLPTAATEEVPEVQ